jgi:RNA polymerase sigma-70 factor (ECF subfamily)
VANENSEQVRYGPRDTLEDSSPSPFEELATLEMRERVELELSRISEPFRTTLILRDIEELSYEEIADVMQVSLGTVKSRLTRGRQALKQRLEQHLEEFGIERESSAEENAIRPRQQAVEVHS